MPPCQYALAVCLCAAATARAEQQPAPAPPDAEMSSAIEELKSQTRSLGLRADSPAKAGRHSPLLDWHGRVFENFRNDALDAVPHEIRQNGGNKGLLRRNQFGFNVAGPAVLPHLIAGRNTYFSLSYEGVREDIARTYLQTIPTMAQRTGDYSDVVDDAGNVIPIYDPTATRPNPGYDPSQPVSTTNLEYLRDPFPGNIIPANRLEAEAQIQNLRLDNKRLAGSEADLQENLAAASQAVDSLQKELKSSRDRVTQVEIAYQKLRDQSGGDAQKITQLQQLAAELQDIHQRREGYLNGILRRYKQITEQYRSMAGVLQTQRTDAPAAGSADLARIQDSIAMAEEDLRQLNNLDAQARLIQKKMAGK